MVRRAAGGFEVGNVAHATCRKRWRLLISGWLNSDPLSWSCVDCTASHHPGRFIALVVLALAAAAILEDGGGSTSGLSCQVLASSGRRIFKFLLNQMCNVLGGIVVELVVGVVENVVYFFLFTSKRRRDFASTVDRSWTRRPDFVVEHVGYNSVLHYNVGFGISGQLE